MIDSEDKRVLRCKRLGHEVPFKYCRLQEGDTICRHILNCWWETFDVEEFLRQNLPPEQLAELASARPPQPKVLSLIELIEQARRNAS